MELRCNEKIIRKYHHHYFPFIIRVFKVLVGSLPFFFMTYLFSPLLSSSALGYVYTGLIVFFMLVTVYVALIYWLDHVLVTNQRVMYIDWKQLLLKKETFVSLKEIQDIFSEEKGILSAFPFFDYGFLRIQTASHATAIEFEEAPNPDGMKDFIYNVRRQILTDEYECGTQNAA